MDEIISLIAKTYGLVGLLIISPLVGVVFLWRENKRLNTALMKCSEDCSTKLAGASDRLVKAQEQRVEDAKAVSTKLVELVSEQSSLNRETNLALDRVGDALAMITRRSG